MGLPQTGHSVAPAGTGHRHVGHGVSRTGATTAGSPKAAGRGLTPKTNPGMYR